MSGGGIVQRFPEGELLVRGKRHRSGIGLVYLASGLRNRDKADVVADAHLAQLGRLREVSFAVGIDTNHQLMCLVTHDERLSKCISVWYTSKGLEGYVPSLSVSA